MPIIIGRNLTNSPMEFIDVNNARVRFPSGGVGEGEFAGTDLAIIRYFGSAGVMTVEVIDHPLDHDGNGIKGGAKAPVETAPAKPAAPAKKPAAKKTRTKKA